jgi:DNA polymerase-3 subunit delta'
MSWSDILNHESVLQRFRKSVQRSRLASTYLFVGPPGVGKRTFALKLAESLLCEHNPETDLDPCGSCPACQQVRARTHPDLMLVSRPKDKNFIPVETFIGDREHRRREGLCHDIGLKPFRGGRKIAIIDDADFLNQESANSLLKTLEEPPPKSLLILIGTSEQRQLPTIVSRSQVIRFNPLTADQVVELLRTNQLVETEIPLEELAVCSQGSIDLAIRLSDKETFEFRQTLFSQLATHDPGQSDFARTVISHVDAAGKDAAEKRGRLNLVGEFAICFYRQWNRMLCGGPPSGEAGLDQEISLAIAPFGEQANRGCHIAALCIQRTMDLQRDVAANVNSANAVASWLTDVGRICREQYVEQVAVL